MNIFKTKDNKIVLGQFPNWQILSALSARILSALSSGTPSNILYFIFQLLLAYWAVLELFQGVNLFRRILGAAVLFFIVKSYL
jgi:hypothetical protein